MKYRQPEATLRQIILKDLVDSNSESSSDQVDLKQKTEALVQKVKKILTEPEYKKLDGLVLTAAAYGCFLGQAFTTKNSNRLAAIKIERLLFYRLSKYYDQQQIFEIARLIQQQNSQPVQEDRNLKLLQQAINSI